MRGRLRTPDNCQDTTITCYKKRREREEREGEGRREKGERRKGEKGEGEGEKESYTIIIMLKSLHNGLWSTAAAT